MKTTGTAVIVFLGTIALAHLICTGHASADVLVSHGLSEDHYTASAYFQGPLGDTPPYRAFDGSLESAWNAGDWPPHWIEVDLGQQYLLKRSILNLSRSGGGASTHEVWLSNSPIGNNRGNATLAHIFNEYTVNHQVLETTLATPIFARYVQINTTQTSSWVAFFEIEVYAILEGAPPEVTDDGVYTPDATQLHAQWHADSQYGIAEYRYAIGTSPEDMIVNWKSAGTATEATEFGLSLQNGQTYYWYVRARSGADEWTETGASDGITVDISAPAAPVVTDDGLYRPISDAHAIHASWAAAEPESQIVEYQYAFGTSPASLLVDWKSADAATEATETLLSLEIGQTYYWYVKARNIVDMWSPVGTSDGIIYYGDRIILKSGNAPIGQLDPLVAVYGAVPWRQAFVKGSYSAWIEPIPGTLWITPDSYLAGDYSYETTFGLPEGFRNPTMTVTYSSDDEGLGFLLNGNAWGGSAGFHTRSTYFTADAGFFQTGTNVFVVRVHNMGSVTGVDFLAEVTYASPLTPEITDDGMYTTDTVQLHASWNAEDTENGIAEYEYAIATPNEIIVDWTSAGTATEATETGLSLQNGQTYYWYVRARNGTGIWGSIGASDGITVDTTPPGIPAVTDDGAFTGSSGMLHASWVAPEPESEIIEYQYAVGTSPISLIVGWKSAGMATEATEIGLPVVIGQTYYWYVKARNGVDMWSETASSDGITIDGTVASTPTVTDDGTYTSSNTTLHAIWSALDPESGIAEYQYAIGRSPADLIVGWKPAGSATDVTETGLSLQNGQVYYWYVKAKNGAGEWSGNGATNGITVDTTPPSSLIVTDDGIYTTSMSSLHATWSGSDPQSGIVEYQYAIGRSLTDLTVDWKSAGASTNVTETGLTLEHNRTYRWYVKAKNGAGLWTVAMSSNGITVAIPSTIGEARNTYQGAVILPGVVTSTATDAAGLWIESSDRSAGLKIGTAWSTTLGDVLQVGGIVQFQDGTPVLTTPELRVQTSGGTPLEPVGSNNASLANDRREILTYFGVNPVGLLIATWGRVTKVDTTNRVFYVNDGSNLADGMGPSYDPFIGLRVAYASGMTPPSPGARVQVTGIRSIQKVTLADDAFVNGEYRLKGTVLYLPVLSLRRQSDIAVK